MLLDIGGGIRLSAILVYPLLLAFFLFIHYFDLTISTSYPLLSLSSFSPNYSLRMRTFLCNLS